MSEHAKPEDLRHLEDVAALGYLLNAIAHDLNNLLTNLMLGADQVQYGGGPEAISVVLDQVQRISGTTRSIQRLGQRNMAIDDEPVSLEGVLEDFTRWYGFVAPRDPVNTTCAEPMWVRGGRRHLVHALSLIAHATGPALGALALHGAIESRPRSAWAGSTETIPMAVIRVVRGTPPPGDSMDFKRLVDGFFDEERSVEQVATMAAWEVVRKVRGRMRVRGGPSDGGVEVILELPLRSPP